MYVCMHFQHRGPGMGESVTSAACILSAPVYVDPPGSVYSIPPYDKSGIACSPPSLNPIEGAGALRRQ